MQLIRSIIGTMFNSTLQPRRGPDSMCIRSSPIVGESLERQRGAGGVAARACRFLAPVGGRGDRRRMDKRFLVSQLIERLRASASAALSASESAATEARDGATPAEKRED